MRCLPVCFPLVLLCESSFVIACALIFACVYLCSAVLHGLCFFLLRVHSAHMLVLSFDCSCLRLVFNISFLGPQFFTQQACLFLLSEGKPKLNVKASHKGFARILLSYDHFLRKRLSLCLNKCSIKQRPAFKSSGNLWLAFEAMKTKLVFSNVSEFVLLQIFPKIKHLFFDFRFEIF